MLHDLFTIGINGETSGGLNTSASNCSSGGLADFVAVNRPKDCQSHEGSGFESRHLMDH